MRTPRLLGAGGLLPFLFLATVVVFDLEGWRSWALDALLSYGALILAFVGGVTWGSGLRQERAASFLFSMLPFFAALAALYLPAQAGLWLLIAAFVAAYAFDRAAARAGLVPDWFMQLRGALTAVVVMSLLAAALSV